MFQEVTPFPVQLVFIVLNVPTLKHTPCWDVWVAVDDLRLTEVYAMACHECMFCQCGSGYITIFLSACQCSFSRYFRDLPVCPMYTFGHTVQGIE